MCDARDESPRVFRKRTNQAPQNHPNPFAVPQFETKRRNDEANRRNAPQQHLKQASGKWGGSSQLIPSRSALRRRTCIVPRRVGPHDASRLARWVSRSLR
jgi:hypothetical protein